MAVLTRQNIADEIKAQMDANAAVTTTPNTCSEDFAMKIAVQIADLIENAFQNCTISLTDSAMGAVTGTILITIP